MKIGITGGAGFIGSHVLEYAMAAGHQVVRFDRRANVNFTLAEQNYDVFLGDVTDPTAMMELAAHVDGIIHLAACLGTQETIANPSPAAITNIFGGLNFLQACARYGIPGVYIGVGNHWMQNTYAITKTAVERFVHMFNAEHDTKVNIVRAVNAYGPGQSAAPPYGPSKVRKITPAFVCRALLGQPIEVYGDGQQVSDMVHVDDVARTLVTALEYAAKGYVTEEVVEIGPVESMRVNTVADVVRWTVEQRYGTQQPALVHLPMRPGEVPGAAVYAHTSTLLQLGIDPAELIGFSEGIAETVGWFHETWLPSYNEAAAPVLVGG
jgi:UDP-glucose 4-epimerase